MLITQSCPILCNPMDCTPWGSFVHGILQARILGWIAISFSRWSSWPRGWTWVSCIAGRFFTIWATRKEITVRALSLVFLRPLWEMLFTEYGMSNQRDQVWLCNSITSCVMRLLQVDELPSATFFHGGGRIQMSPLWAFAVGFHESTLAPTAHNTPPSVLLKLSISFLMWVPCPVHFTVTQIISKKLLLYCLQCCPVRLKSETPAVLYLPFI